MPKNSTLTIYNYLKLDFWTQRKCQKCQEFFTPADFTHQNYQLFFKEVGNIQQPNSLNSAVLEKVIVKLQHPTCPLTCGFSYQKDIYAKI